jgi:hypothetical protein
MEKVLTRNIGADLKPTDLKAYEVVALEGCVRL